MAIDGYAGLPRSGKSHSVVENVIIPALREGRTVVTNIPMLDTEVLLSLHGGDGAELIQLVDGWDSDPDLVDRFPAGAVVVLDEVWRRWASGQKLANANEKDKAFLKEHGHMVDAKGFTTAVVLITQDLSDLAAWVRAMVATTYRTTKLDAVGADNRYRVDVYRGAVTGQRPPSSQLLRSEFGVYRPDVYRFYQSATKSVSVGGVGNERRLDKRAVLWGSTKFRLLLLALIALPVFASCTGWRSYQSFPGVAKKPVKARDSVREEDLAPPAPVAPTPVPVAPVGPLAPVATEPALSRYWRVAAVVWRENGGGLAVLDSPTGQRTVPVELCDQFAAGVDWYCDVDGERVTGWSGQPERGSVWREKAVAPAQVDVRDGERFDTDGVLHRARGVGGPAPRMVAGRDVPVTRLAE